MVVVVVVEADQLQENFDILVAMDPKHIDDILPLISVEKSQLKQFKQIQEEQELNGLAESSIYYFSGKLKVYKAKKREIYLKNYKNFKLFFIQN